MNRALVGHTGFVGGVLKTQARFDALYASRDLDQIVGRSFDQMVVSAVPAAMWLANTHPEQDKANIDALFARLSKVDARHVVLVSTIAVYADAQARPDEDSEAFETAKPYGRHRRAFERMLAQRFERVLILRLPALFGPGLKKNFIYDLIHPIPSFLPDAAYARLKAAASGIEGPAIERGFARDPAIAGWAPDRQGIAVRGEAPMVEAALERAGLTARHLTHPGSAYQFYALEHLWADIDRALCAGLSTLNLAVEPMTADKVAEALTGRRLATPAGSPVLQDMRSRHSVLWGRDDGYLRGADQTLAELKRFYADAREAAP